MNKISKISFMIFLWVSIWSEVGLAVQYSERDYFEAIVNLKTIEPYFNGQPIYLSKDQSLKSKLKIKLNHIIKIIESYVQSNSKEEQAFFNLGKSYSYAHDLDIPNSWEKSVEYLNKTIELNPRNELAHIIQGKNFMDAQKFNKAFTEYNKADNINPIGQARYFMAITNIHLKQTEEAKANLEKYLKSHPQDSSAKQMLNAIESGQITYQ